MNFGASHIVQTSALLKKDSKRSCSTVLTLHTAPKGFADTHHGDIYNSPRSEEAQFRQYDAAAEIVIEQLRETLELSIEELRRHKAFKWNFERFLDVYEETPNGKRPSFLMIKDIIGKVLDTLFVHGARAATPDFKDQQASRLMRAYIDVKQEQGLIKGQADIYVS